MKKIQYLVGIALLAIGLNACAADTVQITNIDQLDVLSVSPCKPTGDSSFTEIVTTMASVLPPAEAEALLARYCEDCMLIKLNLTEFRR